MNIRAFLLGLVALALCACATPGAKPGGDSVIDTMRWVRSLDERVQTVSWRLATANTEFCGTNVGPVLGAEFWSAASFEAKARRFATAAFMLTDQPSVAHVVPGSPAARAGLRTGQEIVAVGDVPLPSGAEGLRVFAAETQKTAKQRKVTLRLTVRDASGQHIVAIESVPACRFTVGLVADASVNAATDGTNIVVTTGLLAFARNDSELAIVIGHEIAHNILGHPEATRSEAVADVVGLALDAMIAAATGLTGPRPGRLGMAQRSASREAQADYVGTYFAARAGYETRNIEQIWKRLGQEHPEALESDLNHPDLEKRYSAMEATSREIQAKKAAGQPLVPNGMKPTS